MAGQKAYVMVDDFAVDDVFDKKYKSSASLKKAMTTAAEKAIDASSKLTTTPPKKGDDTPQFYLMGTLSKLTKSPDGKKELVEAQIKFVIGTWPSKSMFAFANGGAEVSVSRPKDLDDSVEDVAAGAVKGGMVKKVIPALEQRVP